MNALSQQPQQNQQQIFTQALNNDVMQRFMQHTMHPKLKEDDKLIYSRLKFKTVASAVVALTDKYNTQEPIEKVKFTWNAIHGSDPTDTATNWVVPPFSVYNYQSKQHNAFVSQFQQQNNQNVQQNSSAVLLPMQQTVIKLQKPQNQNSDVFKNILAKFQQLGWKVTYGASSSHYVQNLMIQGNDRAFNIPILDLRLVSNDINRVRIDELTIYGLGPQNFYVQMMLSSLNNSSIVAICKKHNLTLMNIENGMMTANGVTSRY